MNSRGHAPTPGMVKRVACAVGGGALLIVGATLLFLPGPGLLLVLGGLLILAHGFPSAQRFVGPVEKRALKAAEDSVASPLRIVFAVGTGLVLIAAGVMWWLDPPLPFESVRRLPFAGWPAGISLIISGLILVGLLVVSYRRVRQGRRTVA